ncbi:MAG: sulfotransferase [Oscillatoria sp. SIO1A7]|nr:sulfotransferase [Oscillatoria sp. SIO1A7]
MLPNFMCIGAQKSATTTILRILEAHPQVFMSEPMETRFFLDTTQLAAGIQKYEIEYFSGWSGQPAVGEKCPGYLYWPGVAERLYRDLGPDLKLIVTLRSPALRAFSQYRHNLARLQESRSFKEALETEANEIQQGTIIPRYGYIARGYYAQQLQRYFNLFDLKQLLIAKFERDIVRDLNGFTKKLYDFIGVDSFNPSPLKRDFSELEYLSFGLSLSNANSKENFVEINLRMPNSKSIPNWLKQLKRGKLSTNDPLVSRIYNPSAYLIQFARDFNSNKPKTHTLSREEELAINNCYFKEDIKLLQDMVPFEVNSWLAD